MLSFRVAGLGLIVAAVLWAAPFWATNDDWSPDQVRQLLQDSPWARPAKVEFFGETGGGIGSGGSRGGVGFPGSRRGGGGGGFPGGGGIGLPDGGWGRLGPLGVNHAFESEVVARWRSARPIQLALARASRDEPPVENKRRYSISLSGLPPAIAHVAQQPERLQHAASLSLKDGTLLRPVRAEVIPRPGTPGVLFEFPRDREITPADRTVEFQFSAADFSVRARFKLKDMIYRGKLEL